MRLTALDSIRGLAALTVLFNHLYFVVPEAVRFGIRAGDPTAWIEGWAWLRYSPLRVLVQGQAAVIVFFVLSGFVLALPFVSGTQPSYPRYLVKRFFRIYAPFAAAILIAAALYVLVAPSPVPGLSDWFNRGSWTGTLTAPLLIKHLLMTGMPEDRMLDHPIWSLVHELRISVVFPLLVLLVRGGVIRALALTLALHAVCVYALLNVVSENTPLGTLLATGQFILFFVFGIALALHGRSWRGWLQVPPGWRALLWLACLVALLWPATLPAWSRLAWGSSAALGIGLSLTSRGAGRFLALPALVWLGRVSYSLYLVHLPVLLTVLHLLYGKLPLWLLLAGAVGLSLIAAEAMYRSVELPSIRMGRRAGGGVAKGPTAPTPGQAEDRPTPSGPLNAAPRQCIHSP